MNEAQVEEARIVSAGYYVCTDTNVFSLVTSEDNKVVVIRKGPNTFAFAPQDDHAQLVDE